MRKTAAVIAASSFFIEVPGKGFPALCAGIFDRGKRSKVRSLRVFVSHSESRFRNGSTVQPQELFTKTSHRLGV